MLQKHSSSIRVTFSGFCGRLPFKCRVNTCRQAFAYSSLTVRSDTSRTSDFGKLSLASCSARQRESLHNVSDTAYKLIRNCCANKDLSAEQLVSLLLRIAAFRHLWQQQYWHDTQNLGDINCMIERVASLTDVLAGGSSEHTLQAIERHPPVMLQHPMTVAERMINIKQLMPQADVPLLVSKRPSVLCMETPLLRSKVQKAAQQLRALMPAIPWEGRLMQDSNLFMTFVTLLDDNNFQTRSVQM